PRTRLGDLPAQRPRPSDDGLRQPAALEARRPPPLAAPGERAADRDRDEGGDPPLLIGEAPRRRSTPAEPALNRALRRSRRVSGRASPQTGAPRTPPPGDRSRRHRRDVRGRPARLGRLPSPRPEERRANRPQPAQP